MVVVYVYEVGVVERLYSGYSNLRKEGARTSRTRLGTSN